MQQTRLSKDSLILSDVAKGFETGGKRLTVLNEINYTFEQGVSYAITGASGSGKSTLLHILAGFEPADAGNVCWYGQALDALTAAELDGLRSQRLGFVFQFHYLIKELSVHQNIALAGMIQKMPADKVDEQVHRLLALTGLTDKQHSMPHHLSGGQQQRVAVARALMGSPHFLLADEPTGNLDKENGAHILDLCQEYQRTHNMGMIIATHDPQVYERMDVVLAVRDGGIVVVRS